MKENFSDYSDFLDEENSKEYKRFFEQTPEHIQMINPDQLNKLQVAYDILKIITKGTGINIDYRLNQSKNYPFNCVSSITITGRLIEISSCEWFTKVSQLANNISVFPLTNGQVEYTLTFHKSMITLGTKEG